MPEVVSAKTEDAANLTFQLRRLLTTTRRRGEAGDPGYWDPVSRQVRPACHRTRFSREGRVLCSQEPPHLPSAYSISKTRKCHGSVTQAFAGAGETSTHHVPLVCGCFLRSGVDVGVGVHLQGEPCPLNPHAEACPVCRQRL